MTKEEQAKATCTTTMWDEKTYAPVEVKDINKVAYDKDNVKLTILGFEGPDGNDSLRVNIFTENNTNDEIWFSLEYIKINGKTVDVRNVSYWHDVGEANGAEDLLNGGNRFIELSGGDIVEYYNINYSDIKTISFNVVVYKDYPGSGDLLGTSERIVLNLK